jgi:hypothetical protein
VTCAGFGCRAPTKPRLAMHLRVDYARCQPGDGKSEGHIKNERGAPSQHSTHELPPERQADWDCDLGPPQPPSLRKSRLLHYRAERRLITKFRLLRLGHATEAIFKLVQPVEKLIQKFRELWSRSGGRGTRLGCFSFDGIRTSTVQLTRS